MNKNTRWMTTKEAADFLGYTPKHVRHLVASGQLNGQKLGRDYIVDRNSVIDFRQRIGPEGQKRGRKSQSTNTKKSF